MKKRVRKKVVKKKRAVRDYKKNKFIKRNYLKKIEESLSKISEEEILLKERLKELGEKYDYRSIENDHSLDKGTPDLRQPIILNPKIISPIKKDIIKEEANDNIAKTIARSISPIRIDKSFLKKESALKGPSESEIKIVIDALNKLKKEISKVVVGQKKVINSLLRGILCNGHVLLEGIPGIAKTLLIRSLGDASGCDVKRVQFTVDLLPTDIIGLTTYIPGKGFEINKGPVFTNFLIADEINRSPPKSQSALIEAMQERIVTIGKVDYPLPNPFFVMATRNPIENSGVYPLSEAQIDRFLFNVIMDYPTYEEEFEVMESNISIKKFEDFGIKAVVTPNDLINAQNIVHKIYLDDKIRRYILAIIKKTREKDFEYAKYISYGASPRGSISTYIAAKANALIDGRGYVLPEDVREVIYEVLRHRLILSYKATVQNLTVDDIIKKLLEEVGVD